MRPSRRHPSQRRQHGPERRGVRPRLHRLPAAVLRLEAPGERHKTGDHVEEAELNLVDNEVRPVHPSLGTRESVARRRRCGPAPRAGARLTMFWKRLVVRKIARPSPPRKRPPAGCPFCLRAPSPTQERENTHNKDTGA